MPPSLLGRLFGLIRWLSRGKRCWARYYWEVGVGEELRIFEEFDVHVQVSRSDGVNYT